MTEYASRLAALRAEPSTDAPRDAARLARVERTRAEMMSQGDAVSATLTAEREAIAAIAQRLASRPLRRVVITGCGDSWFVGQAARLAFETMTGAATDGLEAFDLAAYGSPALGPDSVAIGLSASGTTPAVVDALVQARAQGAFTIGLCNRAGTELALRSDAGLVVHATRKGWPTQSSTAAIALLVQLAIAIARTRAQADHAAIDALQRALDALPSAMDRLALALDDQLRALGATIADAAIVLVAGAGPHAATAAFGAAKLRELGPIHALAMPLEELHHYRAQKPGETLVVVAPDRASRERALDTAIVNEAVGGRMIVVLGEPDPAIESRALATLHVPVVSPLLAPILHSIPLHLLAYHFAVARAARGIGAAPATTAAPA